MDGAHPGHLVSGDGPIHLGDVDHLLVETTTCDEVRAPALLRVWRDDLSLATHALEYASEILQTDIAILRHFAATPIGDASEDVVAALPPLLAAASSSRSDALPGHASLDEGIGADLWGRCDPLLSAHREMARTDLSSPVDVARALHRIETQLTEVAQRQDAAAVRLGQVRSALVGLYAGGERAQLDTPA